MSGPIRYHDFAREYQKLGITIRQGKVSHKVLSKLIEGETVIYPVPVHNNTVKPCYVARVIRTFELTKKEWDGE